jgi:hypothetical protein
VSHRVRRHTRTVRGKTVTVRQHSAADPEAAAQRKRHAFEMRVLRERQRSEALYEPRGQARVPGEKKRRRGPRAARAKKHAKKALRLWRRHKVKAVFYAGLAAGEIGACGAWRCASMARRAVRRLRARWRR